MKKLLSVLLALTLVFSLSVMTFAADETAAETTKPVSDYLDDLLALIQSDDFKAGLEDAKDKLVEIAGDTDQIAGFVDELLVKIEAATGVSVDELKAKLSEAEIFNMFANLYMPAVTTTAAPTTTATVPDTGSAVGGIAIFATLSIAAAAAFVCTKKK